MKESKLEKKLRGIGFVAPPKNNGKFKQVYKPARELMASRLEDKTPIKAAFFAIDIKNEGDKIKEDSIGIIAIGENYIYYSASFFDTGKIDWITFDISKLEHLALAIEEDEACYGLRFEYEEKAYFFADTSLQLPKVVIKETINILSQNPTFRALLENEVKLRSFLLED